MYFVIVNENVASMALSDLKLTTWTNLT